MKERIAHICSAARPADVFADIGCDHGYMTQYMLQRGMCRKAYISDISAKSLEKAEKLLAPYIEEGRCIPVVADGLDGIAEPCDFILIAGMGGEEIVKILERAYIPQNFLFQPMKNTEKLRRYLVSHGAHIERDDTFSEGKKKRKYYDILLGKAGGGDAYSERELRYGRDNLKGSSLSFLFQMREELEKTQARLASAFQAEGRVALHRRRRELEEIIHEVEAIIRYD